MQLRLSYYLLTCIVFVKILFYFLNFITWKYISIDSHFSAVILAQLDLYYIFNFIT